MTVRFAAGIQTLLESGEVALLEVGPGRALSSLARQQPGKFATVTPTMRHPQEQASDVAFLLGSVGKLWAAGVRLDASQLFAGEERRRTQLPTYPFERQRFWIDPDPQDATRDRADAFHKQADIADWFAVPSWARSTSPRRTATPATDAAWLVFADDSALSRALLAKLTAAGHRVATVVAGAGFRELGDLSYAIDPANRANYDELKRSLAARSFTAAGVLYLWPAAARPRRRLFRAPWNPVASYDQSLARYFHSPVFLTQALAGDVDALRMVFVSTHMQSVPGDTEVHPEKAVLLGPCKVIPREYPHVRCTSIDVAVPEGGEAQIAARLLSELEGESADTEVAIRGGDRWVRRYDHVRLDAAGDRTWLREQGVYLLTGGLGGISLAVAEHLASQPRVKIALLGRTPLPEGAASDAWLASHPQDDETSRRIRAVRAIRARGAEVMTIAADAADPVALRRAVDQIKQRFGGLHGVFHAAGTLNDEIIALRAPVARSVVLDAKMKTALVLESVLAGERLDFLVLFSSVASFLGLPGQADYTAANAFLDAMAHARRGREPGRTLAINWNAWQNVGMLASHVKQVGAVPQSDRPFESSSGRPGTHPALAEVISDDASSTLFKTVFDRDRFWLLSEHIVRGGDALISGTGMLEIARAALAYRAEPKAIELRDVFFMDPFNVLPGSQRTMHVKIDRTGDGSFGVFGESEAETFVVGKARYVDTSSAPRVDLAAIRGRCTTPGRVQDGQLVQQFMDFGPRWGCVQRIDLGHGEAIVSLELPPAFHADLDHYHLHPAVLDLATGGAQAIVPGFDPHANFYVPLAYGRLLLRRPMPAKIVSHVRVRDTAAKDSVIFDATLYDQHGEEVAAIEKFVMRKVAASFMHDGSRTVVHAEPEARAHRPETPSEMALREGMTPAEGLEALDRVMFSDFSAQIAACTLPIEPWLDRLAHEAQATLGKTGDDESGPVFTRPSVSAAFAEPRDDIERELATLWQGLLGVSQVGIHDDFFELGGQSLVAVRLFQRIGKKYGVDLPLSTLFQAPTIAECATLLRETLGMAQPAANKEGESVLAVEASDTVLTAPSPARFKHLVAIQRGSGRTPFFCVHGAGGNVLNFRDLSRALHPDQPFYGLQAAGVDGVTPTHNTIHEMADAYLAEILDFQRQGPYLLGGYSGGGIVAFEMARRLTAAGKEVGLLAFIDTFHPRMPAPDQTFFSRLERLQQDGLSYVREAIERKVQSVKIARDDRAIEGHVARGEVMPFHLRQLHMWRTFERAMAAYQIEPWNGKATLFRAEVAPFFFRGGGKTYGWDKDVLGGVDVVFVPGYHETLLLGANADFLVKSLSAAIDQGSRTPAPKVVTTPIEHVVSRSA